MVAGDKRHLKPWYFRQMIIRVEEQSLFYFLARATDSTLPSDLLRGFRCISAAIVDRRGEDVELHQLVYIVLKGGLEECSSRKATGKHPEVVP